MGNANSHLGNGLTTTEKLLYDEKTGLWRGITGRQYQFGKYWGNQYGWTANQAVMVSKTARILGHVSIFGGLAVSGVQYYYDVSKGNTAMAVRDSLDVGMSGVALAWPFGTAAAGIYFGGEALYEAGGLKAYSDNVEQNQQIQGPTYNPFAGPKY
jgi:hypothetical protein